MREGVTEATPVRKKQKGEGDGAHCDLEPSVREPQHALTAWKLENFPLPEPLDAPSMLTVQGAPSGQGRDTWGHLKSVHAY